MTKLQDRALLVRMRRSAYNPNIRDETAAAQVDTAFGASHAGKFYKSLFKNNKKLKTVQSCMTDAYQFHNKFTAPWLDGGTRILSSDYYDKYIDSVGRIRGKMQSALSALGEDYDEAVEKDIERLGGLANRRDYPSFNELSSRFSVETSFFPVPSSGDFRFEVLEEVKQSVDNLGDESKELASKELLGKMGVVLQRIMDNCGKDKPIIHESLLANTLELGEVMGVVNVFDDPKVEEWADNLEALAKSTTTFELRTSALARREFMRKTKELMSSLGVVTSEVESETQPQSETESVI